MMEGSETSRSLASETLGIRSKIPPTCQIMFFSATYTGNIFAITIFLWCVYDYLRTIYYVDTMIKKIETFVPRAAKFRLKSDEELMMKKIFKVVIDVSKAG